MAPSSLSPQGRSIFGKLVMSIHQVTLHRHKPGTLSVQNHLGKELECRAYSEADAKSGGPGNFRNREGGDSDFSDENGQFTFLVQVLQPPGQAPAEVAACNWQLLDTIHPSKHPAAPAPATHPRCFKKPYNFGFFRNVTWHGYQKTNKHTKITQNPKLYFQSP